VPFQNNLAYSADRTTHHEVLVEAVLHDDELLEVLDLHSARTFEITTVRVVLLRGTINVL
jgi:hypothetical protein